jgi:23S rRNA (cytidine1920-2'-O)/16S rRNA (cytidine1409-2'-O)-methyltransferase
VENTVEKPRTVNVNGSSTHVSALCTGLVASTLVVVEFAINQVHFGNGMLKARLDKLLVERGLVPSRERAQALILAGKVLVNEQKVEKAGAQVGAESAIRLLEPDLKYVSRGGLKLEHALTHWNIDVSGKTCLDVGASTGGFTDCLLQHGAARVVAVDTGYGQMVLKLRQDPRVRLLEKTNARYLSAEALGETADFIAMDVSFISATLVLPAVVASAFRAGAERGGQQMVVLVKPQFEVGKEQVGKGGIVRDGTAQLTALNKVTSTVTDLGAALTDSIESPILGAEGNREFLLYAVF